MYVAEQLVTPSFNAVIQFLPPSYSTATNQALYQAFVGTFGTSVTTSMVLGAAIELRSQFKTSLVDDGYSHETLSDNVKSDFQRGLGICGTPEPVDPTYTFVNCKDMGGGMFV